MVTRGFSSMGSTVRGAVCSGLLLAVAACGAGGAEEKSEESKEPVVVDTSEFNQAPVPDGLSTLLDEDFPEKLRPVNGSSLTDRMTWNAVKAVSQIGGKVDPDVQGQCPEVEGRSGETATCTVHYFGEEFEYALEVTSDEGALIRSSGTVAPLPLVRETVEDHLRFQTTFEHVTCDMDDLVVAEEGADTGVACQAWSPEHSALTTTDVATSQSGPEFPNIETEYNAVEKE